MSLELTWITSLVAMGWFSKSLGFCTACSLTVAPGKHKVPDDGLTNKRHHRGSGIQGWSGGGDLSLRLEGRFPLKHRARKASRASDHSLFLHFTSVNGCLYQGRGPLGLLWKRESPATWLLLAMEGQEVSAGSGLRDGSGSGLVRTIGTSGGWLGALSNKVL